MVTLVTSKYSTLESFSSVCNSSTQGASLLADTKKAYEGRYPTITLLNKCYGENAGRNWLVLQLEDLNSFVGSSQPMDTNQMIQTASLLAAGYYYIKVSEYILFFTMFKLGHFGEIYGSLKPNDITSAFRKFIDVRQGALQKIEDENSKVAYDESLRNAISYEQWQNIKKSKVAIAQ